jgi:ABC-type uncharacterized transport system substrate-binding protein
MRRREFVTLVGGTAAMLRLPPLNAQPSSKIWRIGVLETISIALNAPNFDAFRQSLRDLGYVEGKNLIIEYRSAEGRGERFVELAADLLRMNVDVIVTRGTPAVLAAKSATTTTPIVMAAVGEPRQAAAPTDDVAKVAGHANKRTTARVYDRDRLEAARRVAYARATHRDTNGERGVS